MFCRLKRQLFIWRLPKSNPSNTAPVHVLSFKTTIVHSAFSKSTQAALLRFKFCRLKRQLFIRHLPKSRHAALVRFKFCRLKRQLFIWRLANQTQAVLLRFKFCRLKRQLFIRYNPKCDVILENSMIHFVR